MSAQRTARQNSTKNQPAPRRAAAHATPSTTTKTTRKPAAKAATPQKTKNPQKPKTPQKPNSPKKAKAKTPNSANLGQPNQPASPSKNPSQNPQAHSAILDLRLKRELIGIVIAVLSIALFIAVVAPGSAILSNLTAQALRLTFGLGAFALPFLLLIWAVSFFVERSVASSTLRLVIGLVIIFFSALAIIAALSPAATASAATIFSRPTLMSYGGYTGGFIAWALISLVGQAITFVILGGLVIVGAVLIGFSITGLVTRIMGLLSTPKEPSYNDNYFSAYDIQAVPDQGWDPAGEPGMPLTVTAQLAPFADPTRPLYGDFSQGDQGRIPYDDAGYQAFVDDLYYQDNPDAPDDLGDLGSTRRAMAGFEDAEGQLPTAELQSSAAPAQQDAQGAKRTRGSGKAASPQDPQAAALAAAAALTGHQGPPFKLPSLRLLKVSRNKAATKAGESELRQTAAILQDTIDQFGVDAQVEGWVAGPTVTLFKVSLGEGVRLSKINALDEDIALALAAPAVRIFSPIPGTTLVGIEVPNVSRSMILLGDVLPDSPEGPLQLAIGKDVEGSSIVANLEKMPHLLIGGTTGSGKSVAINSMIMSILMRATPSQVRMILIDPKMVELSLYNDIPHLYVPVVTDAQKAASSLAWGVLEMERRLKLFQKAGVKNIEQYNNHVRIKLQEYAQAAQEQAEKNAANPPSGEEDVTKGTGRFVTSANGGDEELPQEMPMIVIVIDELADLMMIAGKDVETSISRLAQLARAAGLHLIIATQRPSTNVITGLIKANIVNRIAFSVASGIDSRVIIDGPGAEDIIGNGDLLFSRPEYGKPQRIQGCFVSEPEIEAVVDYLKEQAEPEYHEDILSVAVGGMSVSMMANGGEGGEDDPLVWEAADIIVSSGFGSTSTLQRRLKVGYARAGRIMDMLEQKGIVGPPNGSKPREVLIDDILDLESLKAIEASDEW